VREWSKVVLSGLFWACVEPSRSQLRTLEPPPQVLTQECGGLRVQLTLDRRRQSASVADLFVTDAAGHILSDISPASSWPSPEKPRRTSPRLWLPGSERLGIMYP
jgi:hypothetical protein